MADKKTALVLGGTVPHIELIHQLQARGYYVILVDYLDDSPARPHADEHIQESTLDLDAVLKIAQEHDAALVISSAIDQANITCCYVAEKLGLPHPYSYETALDVTHKDRMKRIMVVGDVPTAPFINADDIDSFAESSIGFPCVVKPTNSNGSKGVRVAKNMEELNEYLPLAKAASRTNEAIVEAFVSGVEVSSYFYVQGGKAYLVGTCQKSNYTSYSKDAVRQYESAFYPAKLADGGQENLVVAADRIASAFGLVNTPLFLQAIVDSEGDVSVLEFAPRLGGGLCFRSIPLLSGLDYIAASIASFLGEEVDVDRITHDERSLMIGNMFAKPGIFDHVCGVDEAAEKGFISEFYSIKAKGGEIGSDGSSGSRFGQFIALGSSLDELLSKDSEARKLIKAYDVDGNELSF